MVMGAGSTWRLIVGLRCQSASTVALVMQYFHRSSKSDSGAQQQPASTSGGAHHLSVYGIEPDASALPLLLPLDNDENRMVSFYVKCEEIPDDSSYRACCCPRRRLATEG